MQAKSKHLIVDVCPACKGIWFDDGELSQCVNAMAVSEEIEPYKPTLFQKREVSALHKIDEKIKFCPRCETALKKFNYAYDSNIILDKCKQCGGVWTDKREAKQIAQYVKADPKTMATGAALAAIFPEVKDNDEVVSKWAAIFILPKIIAPFDDDVERQKFPLMTILLILLCTLFAVGRMFIDPEFFLETLDFLPKDFFPLDLFVSMFVQGGILHFVFNMFFLWLFGDNVEDRFSRLGFLGFYFACGVFASLLYFMFNWEFSVAVIGVSGAVSGIMGAYFIFYPTAMVKVLFIWEVMEVPAVLCLGLWFIFQFFAPYMFGPEAVSISYAAANVGGFIFGGAVAAIKKNKENN